LIVTLSIPANADLSSAASTQLSSKPEPILRATPTNATNAVQSTSAFWATDWAFGSVWGEFITLSASAGLVGGSFLVHQRRSGWGPDAAHSLVRNADSYSFATVGGAIALSAAYYVLEAERFHEAGYTPKQSYGYALPTILSDVEALLIGSGATSIMKRRAGRCRPRAWDTDGCNAGSDENYKAFPSGHTMIPSALAGVHLALTLRNASLANSLFFAGLELSAISTGALRVMAGAHSFSDVGVGYLLGHVVGLGVGLAHPRTKYEQLPVRSGIVHPAFAFDGKTLTFGGAF
jgi:membrane-associated phospholipid phosphatase